jgi:hypothetical protein
MVRSIQSLHDRQRPAVERQGLGGVAQLFQTIGQIVHAGERVRMLHAEFRQIGNAAQHAMRDTGEQSGGGRGVAPQQPDPPLLVAGAGGHEIGELLLRPVVAVIVVRVKDCAVRPAILTTENTGGPRGSTESMRRVKQ